MDAVGRRAVRRADRRGAAALPRRLRPRAGLHLGLFSHAGEVLGGSGLHTRLDGGGSRSATGCGRRAAGKGSRPRRAASLTRVGIERCRVERMDIQVEPEQRAGSLARRAEARLRRGRPAAATSCAPLLPRRAPARRDPLHAASRSDLDGSPCAAVDVRGVRRRRGGASSARSSRFALGAETGLHGRSPRSVRAQASVSTAVSASGRNVSPVASARSIGTFGRLRHSSPGSQSGSSYHSPMPCSRRMSSASQTSSVAPPSSGAGLLEDRAEGRRWPGDVERPPVALSSASWTSHSGEIADVDELHRPLRRRGRRPSVRPRRDAGTTRCSDPVGRLGRRSHPARTSAARSPNTSSTTRSHAALRAP